MVNPFPSYLLTTTADSRGKVRLVKTPTGIVLHVSGFNAPGVHNGIFTPNDTVLNHKQELPISAATLVETWLMSTQRSEAERLTGEEFCHASPCH